MPRRRWRTTRRWSRSPIAWPATPPSQRAGPATGPELLEEGLFRAARFGTAAQLPDADGRLHEVDQLLDDALTRAGDYAGELRCEAELATLPDLLALSGGAGRQRGFYEIAGMDALPRELSAVTGGPPPDR